jgi:hypothetical protein
LEVKGVDQLLEDVNLFVDHAFMELFKQLSEPGDYDLFGLCLKPINNQDNDSHHKKGMA